MERLSYLSNIERTAGADALVIRSQAALAGLLKQASEAHHVYEKTHGVDADWPAWYARFIAELA